MKILAFDIGASFIKSAIVDLENGVVIGTELSKEVPKPTTYHEVAEQISILTRRYEYEGPLAVAFAGTVIDGVVMTPAYGLGEWVNFPIVESLKKDLERDVYVVNDADAVLYAELHFGKPEDREKKIFAFTCGTNGGGALAFKGQVLDNAEIGNNRTSANKKIESELSWEEWAVEANEFLWEIEGIYWPDLFVLGGGFSNIGEEVLPHLKTRTPIRTAIFQNHSGCAGAAVFLSKNIIQT